VMGEDTIALASPFAAARSYHSMASVSHAGCAAYLRAPQALAGECSRLSAPFAHVGIIGTADRTHFDKTALRPRRTSRRAHTHAQTHTHTHIHSHTNARTRTRTRTHQSASASIAATSPFAAARVYHTTAAPSSPSSWNADVRDESSKLVGAAGGAGGLGAEGKTDAVVLRRSRARRGSQMAQRLKPQGYLQYSNSARAGGGGLLTRQSRASASSARPQSASRSLTSATAACSGIQHANLANAGIHAARLGLEWTTWPVAGNC
jgi:hypothetical protein